VRRTVRFTSRKVEVADEITNLHSDRKLGLLFRDEVSLQGKTASVRLAGLVLTSSAGAAVQVGATNTWPQLSGCLKILPGQNYRVTLGEGQQVMTADANGLVSFEAPPCTNAAVSISPE